MSSFQVPPDPLARGQDQGVSLQVSIIIPMLNERNSIVPCIDSILSGDYSRDRLEIIVIDGGSTDGSLQLLGAYADEHHNIRVIEHPGSIASALNRGIRESRGEIIVRMDAHATYSRDYVSRCVELLLSKDAACVGGVQRATGSGYASECVAIATSSRFGVGDARFRYADSEEWVDTVYLGAWRKQVLESIGGYDESWLINEDYELNYRIRLSGGKILLSPRIRCRYFVRTSLRALAKQYFRYGFWKARTLRTHPQSLRARQLAPPALILSLLISTVLMPIHLPIAIVVPTAYLIAVLGATGWCGIRKGYRFILLLPFVFLILHLSWGAGFWAGVFRFGPPKLTLASLRNAFRRTSSPLR